MVPGPQAGLLGTEVLEAHYGAFLSLLHVVGPTRHRWQDDRYGWGWFAEDLDQYLTALLIDLYRNGEDSIDDLVEDTWEWLNDKYDLSDEPPMKLELHHDLVASALRRALDLFAELGIVGVRDIEEIPTRYGNPDLVGGRAKLTPLGTWAVQRFASRITSAPVVGALRDATAAELLTAAADLPTEEATVEIDTWATDRGAAAAADLVAALPSAGETERGLGFRALLRIGPGAADAVDTIADHPELAPYVTVCRADTLSATEAEVDCGDDPERYVLLLHAVIELWGPAAATATWAANAAQSVGSPAMLDRVWRVKRPETEEVLAAIGGNHPDKTVSKAARKALFKFRTAG